MTSERTVFVFTGVDRDEFELLDEKRKVPLPIEELKKNLRDFTQSLSEMLPTMEEPRAGVGLKTLAVAVGINAKGQVGFLGTGVEVGGTATLTITYERSKAAGTS